MMKLNVIFIIVNVMNYPSSLCLNFQTFCKKGMQFERFTQLTIMQNQQKLIQAFQKISTRAKRDKNIYKSVNNFFRILEIYSDMLQVMCDLRNFLANLLNDEILKANLLATTKTLRSWYWIPGNWLWDSTRCHHAIIEEQRNRRSQ